MVKRAVDEFGRLDMAYNNAGILGPVGDIDRRDRGRLRRGQRRQPARRLDLHEARAASRWRSKAAARSSTARRSGGLVGLPGRAAYHATKHGVIGLTKSAAIDVAPREASA